MTAPSSANSSLSPGNYDPTNHQVNIALRLTNIQTDTSVTPNITYGDLAVNASVTANPPVSVVSTNNSTTTLLTANSVFTGTSESALQYGSISVEVFADQASAASGLVVQQSQDGTNWDTKNQYSIVASTPFQQTINLVGQYFQIKYTNGGTDQGVFRLQTIKMPGVTGGGGGGGGAVTAISGAFVAGAIVDLATLLALEGTSSDPNTANSIMGRLTKIRDLLAATLTVQGTITEANSAASKADLDTLAGIVSGAKAATKAAAGDFVDLATLAGVVSGAKASVKAATGDIADLTTLIAQTTLTPDVSDRAARLLGRVSQVAAQSVSGTLQTAQAGNAAGTPLSVLGMAVAILTVNMAGFTGTVNFEGQEDGTNFKAVNAVLVGTNTITSTAIGATSTTINLYEIPVAGLQQIQARTSSVSAGNVTITAHAVPVPYNGKVVNANIVSDASGMKTDLDTIVTNTTNAGTPTAVQGAGAAAGTSWRIKGDFTEQASLSAGSLNADLVASFDVSAYKWFSLQLTTIATGGTISFQGSNDNTTFFNVIIVNAGSNAAPGTSVTATGLYGGPIYFRWLRIRQTAWTSGSSTGTAELYTKPPATATNAVGQTGTWTVQVSPPTDATLLASGAHTTTQTVADQTNSGGRGIRVVLDMTTVGTGSVTLEIDAKDIASGKYVAQLTGAAVTTNSTNVYVIYPGLTPVANSVVSDALPRVWRVIVTANNANSATYSVGYSYLA